MNKFYLSKEKSTMIKGIAIILMIAHHLFAFPERILEPSEYFSIPIFDNSIAYYIGVFSRICVGIYLFLSGYGLYIKYSNEKNFKWILKKIKSFLVNYWLVIGLVFIPLGIILGKYNISIKELILNATCIKISFITSWWFVRIYIELLLIFPIIIKLSKISLFNNIVTFVIIPIIFTKMRIDLNFISNPLLNVIYEITTYIPLIGNGVIFAKFDLFSKFNMVENKINLDKVLVNLFILIIVFIIRTIKPGLFYMDLLFVPFFIYSTINLINLNCFIRVKTVLLYLGVNSTNLWLIHDILIEKYFQKLVYYPKLDTIVLIWVFILILPFSVGINKLMKHINSIKFKNTNRSLIKIK